MREIKQAIGRSRTGDQLHKCSAYLEDGKLVFGGCNSHCNNHMHLQPLGVTRSAGVQPVVLKYRPGLFCAKCFGPAPFGEYVNATITDVPACNYVINCFRTGGKRTEFLGPLLDDHTMAPVTCATLAEAETKCRELSTQTILCAPGVA